MHSPNFALRRLPFEPYAPWLGGVVWKTISPLGTWTTRTCWRVGSATLLTATATASEQFPYRGLNEEHGSRLPLSGSLLSMRNWADDMTKTSSKNHLKTRQDSKV
ncbi:hypothetical protein Bpro_3225 [Polaromonas sp. JS666]|nr:hypothetical protein Bpro_3225 [Polaromonas sp. JS666]